MGQGINWQQEAAEVGQGIVGAGMGLLLGKHQDKRQLKQQKKLQDLQIAGNQQMLEQQRLKEMKMWEDTNYSAQVLEMKKAGINPALLYGMSGGGGVTTGGGGGTPTGATASQGGGQEIQTAMGLMSQRAQIELMRAQAENIKADTANKPLEGGKLEAETGNITQGTKNQQVQERLLKLQEQMGTIDLKIKDKTQEEAIDIVVAELGKAQQEVMQMEVKTFTDRATQLDKVDILKAEAAGALLRNEMTRAGIQKTWSDIEVNQQQIESMIVKMAQEWRELEIKQQGADANTTNAETTAWRLKWDKEMEDVAESTELGVNVVKTIVSAVGAGALMGKGGKSTPKVGPGTKRKVDSRFYRYRKTDVGNIK